MPSQPKIFRPPGWKPAPPAPKNRNVQDPYYGTAEWKALSRQCKERDRWRCTAPECPTPDRGKGGRLIADHIIPRREGGPDLLANLQSLCPSCDNRKHGKRGK